MKDIISANASLDHMRQNMDMKKFAKEVLLDENYKKFMKSYKFTFWSQLLGVRRHIVGGANRTLFSVDLPPRLCRTGT